MDNLPKQLYIARFIMHSGATFDIVTEKTRDEIEKILKQLDEITHIQPPFVVIPGWNDEKQWPVDLTLDPNRVENFFHGPFKQWLLGRRPTLVQS